MPYYSYEGRTIAGKIRGKIRAETKNEAVSRLKTDGVVIKDIKASTNPLLYDIHIGRAVKQKDFVIFLRQFATLIKAGISLLESTRILAQQTNSRKLGEALRDVSGHLESGRAFSEASALHPKVFPNLFVQLIRAGEAGGNLEEILERLAVYYEKQFDTRQKIISALLYPSIVGGVSFLIILFLLTFVVPRFADMFLSIGGDLPAMTKFTLQASGMVERFWYILILVPALAVVLYQALIRRSPKVSYTLDAWKLRVPVFGPLLKKAALVRMTSTLSSLMNSSVPILKSLEITRKVVENKVIEKAIEDSFQSLEQGETLSRPLKESPVFPPLVAQMIAIGEETGSLDYMLAKVAEFYDSELEYATERLKTLIEPVMILFLSIVVGSIVASIAIPMFSAFENIR
ncbi:type II secretion system F family protein [Halobacillus sp. ACCC02827]|uniref:type II secretion system F family protein n=1 Tax=Bacillaceae TaxID=186817 RepID=UPI0002A521F4|nr:MULTISPECIES: type II secretion system F family protein [Bacillaceae]ELK45693.1 type II secretion system F domain-containing protein [Halobacillus sp. BAB-2008]QHT47306.1 type II secretion system F family protein [Bacillus sp. SB49]WJE14539.1 type II secretion system F family protein [Halobacillus sp. ACCC02827]